MLNKRTNRLKNQNANLGRTPTFSYRAARNKLDNSQRRIPVVDQSSRSLEARTPEAKLKYILYFRRVISLVFLLILLFNLRVSGTPKILVKEVPNTITSETSEYGVQIGELWSQNFLNNSKITINTRKIGQQIQQKFPEIETIYIDIPVIGSKPIVWLTPSSPRLILSTQANNFYVGSDGTTLALVNSVIPNQVKDLPTVLDESGLVPNIGSLALPSNDIEAIIRIVNLFEASNLELSSIILSKEPNQLDIVVKDDKYTIKFALNQSAEQGVGGYLALRKKFSLENITPSSYVDLRVPDKAFYR